MGAQGQEGTEIRMLLGGDVMLARGVSEWLEGRSADAPLAALHPLTRAADLFAINLECAITERVATFEGAPKVFYFRAIPKAVQTLSAAGVDVVSLANNHALDAGLDGLRDTLQHVSAAGIAVAGAGESLAAARGPCLLECKDLRVGFVACCDHQSDFAAAPDRPGIWYLDLWRGGGARPLLEAVEALSVRTDLTVVALHWQPNWAPVVAAPVRRLADQLAEAGADVIWGHSPHHFQGVEWLGDAVCLYSTGDLVDDYAVDPTHRNDRQLLFEVQARAHGILGVRARPLRLAFAHTLPAGGEDRRWIRERFARMCEQVGSRIEEKEGWLHVHPQ